MTSDPTEATRRWMLESGQPARDAVNAKQLLTTEEVREQYEVHAFAAPFAIVTRKADGKRGTLEFTHSPRVYFDFQED